MHIATHYVNINRSGILRQSDDIIMYTSSSREQLKSYWIKSVRAHNRPYNEDELLKQVELSVAFLTDDEVAHYVNILAARGSL